ncbi:MAG TPA: hypothetical protein VMX97_01335, partial [Hyphomicrobiaceae bacterium]|nr:hypothetical protein [Hyphomicrobiaceae bacterium]
SIDRDAPAKFRELLRYAIQGEDHTRELEFHAQTIRSSRFVFDWPWHSRFWLGCLYGACSNFGRSLIRPLILWLALVLVSAMYFLGQSPEVAKSRAVLKPQGSVSTTAAYLKSGLQAWSKNQPCVNDLSSKVRYSTNAPTEALQLAFKNAFVIIDGGGSDGAHRTYGCLYGLEHYGDNPTRNPVCIRSIADSDLGLR